MLISILIIGFFFGILLNETDFLRIRLIAYSESEIGENEVIENNSVEDTPVNNTVLLLPETCTLTRIQNELKDCKYYSNPKMNDWRDSYQQMVIGNQTIIILASYEKLYQTIKEINKIQITKPRQTSFYVGTNAVTHKEDVRIGSHHEWVRWNEDTQSLDIISKYKKGYHHRIENDYKTVYNDGLIPVEWLKQHEHDLDNYEPTIEISVDNKEFNVNGNYKKGMIQGFMSEFTHKERAGKKGLVPVMNGEHLEKYDDNLYFACEDGKHLS